MFVDKSVYDECNGSSEMERNGLRRHQLYTIAIVLMWIGGLEICANFLAKFWFSFQISLTPLFFLALIVGLGLYLFARFV